jgi:hypothetical protein
LSCLFSVFIVDFLCCFCLGSAARSIFLFVPAPVFPRYFSLAVGAHVSLLDPSFTPPSPAAFLTFGVLLWSCSSCSPAGPSQANSFDLLFVFLHCAHSACSCPQTGGWPTSEERPSFTRALANSVRTRILIPRAALQVLLRRFSFRDWFFGSLQGFLSAH